MGCLIEWLMVGASVTLISREVEQRHENGRLWGGVTILLYIASLFVLPTLPFLRVVIVAVVVFIAWMVYLSRPMKRRRR